MLNPHKLLFVSILCTAFFISTQAQVPNKIDSLLHVLSTSKEDTSKANTLIALGSEFKRSNPDSSIILANQALSLSIKLKSKKHIADSYHIIAWANYEMGNYPIALENNFKALALREEITDKSGIATSLNAIGNIYNKQGNYPKALDNHFKALKLNEDIGNKNGIALTLGNIGIVYHEKKDFPKALDYNLKALKIGEQIGDKERIAKHLCNVGACYYEQGDNPKALDYYFRALKIVEQIGYKSLYATILGNIGSVYSEQGDALKALDYYFKALKIAEQIGDKSIIAIYLGNIGYIYIEKGKYGEAEVYVKKAIAVFESIGAMDHLRQFEELLSHLYDTTGRYKLALEHFKKAMVLKDTLLNEEKNRQITRQEMNYEFEKKEEATKAEQGKKDFYAQQELQKQKLLKFSFIGALFLVLILFYFIYKNYRTRQKLKLETIRNNIAADLHDDIGSTLNSISLFSEVAKQETGKPIPALDQIGVSARKIIDAMSDIVWTINPENDTFENVIARMRSLSYMLLKAKGIEFTFKADENINHLTLPMPVRKNIYLLFKEATNNLVKYSNATRASFHISIVNKIVKMVIQDNGVGFDMENAQMGNGIKNMKRRAEEIGAQLVIESAEGTGTNIELSLKS